MLTFLHKYYITCMSVFVYSSYHLLQPYSSLLKPPKLKNPARISPPKHHILGKILTPKHSNIRDLQTPKNPSHQPVTVKPEYPPGKAYVDQR